MRYQLRVTSLTSQTLKGLAELFSAPWQYFCQALFWSGLMLTPSLIFAAPSAADLSQQQLPVGVTCQSRLLALPGLIEVTIHNQTNQTLWISSWHSPWDAWFSEFLTVEQQAVALPYQGAKAKRGAMTLDDFVSLASGATLNQPLDLSQAYPLGSGPVLVQFKPIEVYLQDKVQQISDFQPEHRYGLQCTELIFAD